MLLPAAAVTGCKATILTSSCSCYLLQLHSTCKLLVLPEVRLLLLLLNELTVRPVKLGPPLCLVGNQTVTTPAVAVAEDPCVAPTDTLRQTKMRWKLPIEFEQQASPRSPEHPTRFDKPQCRMYSCACMHALPGEAERTSGSPAHLGAGRAPQTTTPISCCTI